MFQSWISRAKAIAASRLFARALLAIVFLLLLVETYQHMTSTAHTIPSVRSSVTEALSFHQGGEEDWSQYAYCQYVTKPAYLCNSVMIFEALERLGA